MDSDDLLSSENSDLDEVESYGRMGEKATTSTTMSRKRKCPPRDQPFMDNWLTIPEFKGWLVKKLHSKKMKPYCSLCEKVLTCSKTGIKRHEISKRHQDKAKTTKTTTTLRQVFNQMTTDDATTTIELKLCAFIAQHNLPLSLSDDMVELLRSLFPNDATLKRVKLGKQKATNIVRQVLGFDYLKELVSLLRSRFFSVIIDEATDQSTKKQLAIVATFFDMERFEMQYWLVDMLETDDGSAKGIYSKMKEAFSNMNIPMSNIIGYSSDTTNVMFGQYNSVVQLLKSEFSYVQAVKCSCHLIHLVSSHAASKLPKSVEDLCRDVYAHFHRSSKRQDVYREFQAFYGTEPLKLLSPAQTRWLSLQECVNRILEQYVALKNYFILTANEDPSHTNDRILASLQNPFFQAYLEFLSFQLERFNAFNRLFQSERPLLHNLKIEVEGLLKAIASDFMKLSIVKKTKAEDLDPTDVQQHVPLRQTYLGMGATTSLREIEASAQEEEVNKFLTTCKDFLIESILQIKSKFDLNAEYHDIVQCLHPSNAANLNPRSLAIICQKLPYLSNAVDTNNLDVEWRLHALDEKVSEDLPFNEYWLAIRNAKIPTGEAKYPNLIKFITILFSLPFANAAVERVFSQLKLVKTDHRNSLKSTSLVSLLQSKMSLKNRHVTAASLKPSKDVLQLAKDMQSNATENQVIELRKDFLSKLS